MSMSTCTVDTGSLGQSSLYMYGDLVKGVSEVTGHPGSFIAT